MSSTGMALLQHVSARILARWLAERGKLDVQVTDGREAVAGRGVDLTYAWQGTRLKIKVKPDPYFGTDETKIGDRSLSFYREDASAYAFESISNSQTREPGWVSESTADELFYYRIVLAQPEDEIRALVKEPDPVFFSELWVDRDELVTMPMPATRAWFESHADNYQARPVVTGGVAAWNRLIPREDVHRSVPGLTVVGPIFRTLKA